jgi:hypothetical protein
MTLRTDAYHPAFTADAIITRGRAVGVTSWRVVRHWLWDLDFHGKRLKPDHGFHTLHGRHDQSPAKFALGETNKELITAPLNRNLIDMRSKWTNFRRFFITEEGYIGVAASK